MSARAGEKRAWAHLNDDSESEEGELVTRRKIAHREFCEAMGYPREGTILWPVDSMFNDIGLKGRLTTVDDMMGVTWRDIPQAIWDALSAEEKRSPEGGHMAVCAGRIRNAKGHGRTAHSYNRETRASGRYHEEC